MKRESSQEPAMHRTALPGHILETLQDIIKAAGPLGPGGRKFTRAELDKIGMDLLKCGDDIIALVSASSHGIVPRDAG